MGSDRQIIDDDKAFWMLRKPELKLVFVDCILESREDIVRERVIKILEENGMEKEDTSASLYSLCRYDMIYNGRIPMLKVIIFADKYGCTVDYLLGRTDTPYYTM